MLKGDYKHAIDDYTEAMTINPKLTEKMQYNINVAVRKRDQASGAKAFSALPSNQPAAAPPPSIVPSLPNLPMDTKR